MSRGEYEFQWIALFKKQTSVINGVLTRKQVKEIVLAGVNLIGLMDNSIKPIVYTRVTLRLDEKAEFIIYEEYHHVI